MQGHRVEVQILRGLDGCPAWGNALVNRPYPLSCYRVDDAGDGRKRGRHAPTHAHTLPLSGLPVSHRVFVCVWIPIDQICPSRTRPARWLQVHPLPTTGLSCWWDGIHSMKCNLMLMPTYGYFGRLRLRVPSSYISKAMYVSMPIVSLSAGDARFVS